MKKSLITQAISARVRLKSQAKKTTTIPCNTQFSKANMLRVPCILTPKARIDRTKFTEAKLQHIT